MSKQLYIYMDAATHTCQPMLMGVLQADAVRGKEVFSFEFDRSWLANPLCRQLDPELLLYGGKQFADTGKSNFGLFSDSAPDRWGRVLLDRREAEYAQLEQRPVRPLLESDYLLGVYDASRMGALRIKTRPDGPFLDNDTEMSAPPFSAIRDLAYASWQLESDSADCSRWLKMLLAPGSSLGGARPKANVTDENGHLWVAKFPSRNDRCDVGAWEAVCMNLAARCGIEVPAFRTQRFSGGYHTFLSKRFDRDDNGGRLHFTSAMTMLGYGDGAEGVSYLELAEWIAGNCADVETNLRQLWRRIVFSILVSNTDDHLRNHGFLLYKDGWHLSPAYDINPDEYGKALSLNITETSGALDLQLARTTAPYYGLSVAEADDVIAAMRTIVNDWRKEASALHISREEQDRKAPAFHLTE